MTRTDGFQDVVRDNESLALFLRKVAEFDEAFCKLMVKGCDFTLKLEVHGNKGEILHAKVNSGDIERPHGVEKRIEEKSW